jgi:DNA-binding NarL/FixJ family response regulator
MAISVAVVEDNPDYRAGISHVLRTSPGFTCVGSFATAEDLIDQFDEVASDVVLMDIGLPVMSGIDATALLKRANPRTEIIMLSVLDDDESIFRALCAGASGYVSKPVMPQDLLLAVEHAFTGGTPMSPRIARRVVDLFRQHVPPPAADYNLTPRELEVLQLLIDGDDFKRIAERLFLPSALYFSAE